MRALTFKMVGARKRECTRFHFGWFISEITRCSWIILRSRVRSVKLYYCFCFIYSMFE